MRAIVAYLVAGIGSFVEQPCQSLTEGLAAEDLVHLVGLFHSIIHASAAIQIVLPKFQPNMKAGNAP